MPVRAYPSPVSIRPGLDALAVVLGTLVALPVAAQNIGSTVVIFGRVEDAVSHEPVEGALVVSGDSARAVFADSLGDFWISLNSTPPYVVVVEQFGYEPTTFELPEYAPSRLSVLMLEPAPIPVEGVTVVDESALTALSERMGGRRNAYSGLVFIYDRDQILTLGGGSAFDLVRRRSLAYQCTTDFGQLCRRVRGREGQLLVCVDERRSFAAISELDAIPLESVIMAEFYGPTVGFGLYGGGGVFSRGASPFSAGRTYEAGQVRIYTRQWMVSTAGRGARVLWPAAFGC